MNINIQSGITDNDRDVALGIQEIIHKQLDLLMKTSPDLNRKRDITGVSIKDSQEISVSGLNVSGMDTGINIENSERCSMGNLSIKAGA